MKLRSREGSTLALTIIIFAVLMIFATFTMGFMVTENKQSIFYQNKTQAYYIAKSGADIIETALNQKLLSINDIDEHNIYIDQYVGGVDVGVDINGITNAVINKETLHGNPVLTITTTARYPNNDNGVLQSVKKVMYNNRTFMASNFFIPNLDGRLFQFLDQDSSYHPKEVLNNGTFDISGVYASRATPETAQQYKNMAPLKPVTDFSGDTIAQTWYVAASNSFITSQGSATIGTTGETTDIYVNGNLELSGNINFEGKVNIYVRDFLTLNSNTNILSDFISSTEDGLGNKLYDLNIFVYGSNLYSGKSLMTDPDANVGISNFSMIGNLHVKTGKVDILFKNDSEIDGSIIYHGTDSFYFSSDDNGKSKGRIIGGSILAPNTQVDIGIETNKVEMAIGGFVIADKISVYANTSNHSNWFYEQSGQGNKIIQTEVPIESNELTNENYGSYYINPNQ